MEELQKQITALEAEVKGIHGSLAILADLLAQHLRSQGDISQVFRTAAEDMMKLAGKEV